MGAIICLDSDLFFDFLFLNMPLHPDLGASKVFAWQGFFAIMSKITLPKLMCNF